MITKSIFKFSGLLVLFLFIGQLPSLKAQIASNYPHDSLIQTDPDVIFAEMFEQNSISTLLSSVPPSYKYQTSPLLAHITFGSTVPAGSHGNQSLKLTTSENSSSLTDPYEDANIRMSFPGISDSVFVRYYVKYNNAHTFHHSGVWMGGTNPANFCGNCITPGRTIPTSGDSAFVVGTEIRDSATHFAKNFSKFGFYNYWMGMKPLTTAPNAGIYYGNGIVSPSSSASLDMNAWNCIEVMIKLNNPVTDSTGELKLWINGQLIGHYGKGFPNGSYNQADFNEGIGSPFEGFRWRSNPAVVFNYIWLKNYATDNSLYPSDNDIYFDHVVVAKKYIGPIYQPVALPVEFISFNGYNKNGNHNLTWTTSSENNSDKFVIERSFDGYNFKKIGELKASTSSSTKINYSFTDNHVLSGIHYYRLNQIDINGNDNYSKIIAIQNSSERIPLKAYHNPYNNLMIFSSEIKRLIIFNAFGQLVINQANITEFSTEALPSGIYIIQADHDFFKLIVSH